MVWWLLAVALLFSGALIFFWFNFDRPWRELEEVIALINRGQQPPTFLISGHQRALRVSLALETLLTRQQQLDLQVSRDAVEMRAVLSAITDGLIVIDSGDRIRFFNPAFEELYGAVTADAALLDYLREADVLGAIREARRKKEPAVAEIGAPDKRIQFAAIPILHSPKSAGSVVGIFHDVTKVKQTERIRRDFVANVSHELRTPLSIFRGNLETLLEEPALAEDERTHIYQAMKRHSDRLNLLAEDLLKLARLESKEMSLEIAPVKLADFLQRVTKDWSPRLKAGNLHIDLQVSPNLPPLPADEFRLEQVVHNLLDNAVNYSHPGGCITVAANETQNEIILSVADEGVGIPAADLPRIFERFYRADRARSRELGGTGLGLSIVKHIAQLHGGDVSAKSEQGKGTVIRVLLPRVKRKL